MKFDISTPLLGFEDLKEVELEKIDDIFMKMQDVNNEHISFTLIDPFILREYDFEVPDSVQELLEIDENSNILVLNIVLLQTPVEDSIVNFIGPILFNTDSKKAMQIILPESDNYEISEKISTFLGK
ncbi:MAG: flagellar assembly protein FliW [Campylobacterota bacterium]|nr:flagellar assembly protein FliW [Campylobacterota bacterium]